MQDLWGSPERLAEPALWTRVSAIGCFVDKIAGPAFPSPDTVMSCRRALVGPLTSMAVRSGMAASTPGALLSKKQDRIPTHRRLTLPHNTEEDTSNEVKPAAKPMALSAVDLPGWRNEIDCGRRPLSI